jgi:hypothetical protein
MISDIQFTFNLRLSQPLDDLDSYVAIDQSFALVAIEHRRPGSPDRKYSSIAFGKSSTSCDRHLTT